MKHSLRIAAAAALLTAGLAGPSAGQVLWPDEPILEQGPLEASDAYAPPYEVEPGDIRAADGSCPGVVGWQGHLCDGMSAFGLFGTSFACDALCTWNGGDVIDGLQAGRDAVPAGQSDVFLIELDDEGRLRVETRDAQGQCGPSADTEVLLHRLADGVWRRLDRYDDVSHDPAAPSGRCETVEIGVEAGLYAVEIRGFNRGPVREYRYRIEGAVTASGGGVYRGSLPFWGAGDRFDLWLDAPALVCTGDGAGGCPGDTMMQAVERSTGDSDANDDFQGSLCACLELPAGDYALSVTGYNDGTVPPYVLVVP